MGLVAPQALMKSRALRSRLASCPRCLLAAATVLGFDDPIGRLGGSGANGNATKSTLAPGVSGFGFATSSAYDKLNRLASTTDARQGTTQLGYNGRQDLTQVSDPRSLLTQYPRNGLGDATQVISPDTGTATHSYDAAGNLSTRTDSRGAQAAYTYDALNRMTQVAHTLAASTLTHTRTYDQSGPGFANGIGRLTSTTHPSGSTQLSYDALGRITQDTQRINAAAGANAATVSLNIGYGYDSGGRMTSVQYPSGRTLGITYDAAGQPASLSLAPTAGGTAATLISQIQWEPFGAVKSWQWQLGAATRAHERMRDGYGRIVRYRMGNTVRDLSYDAADRIGSYTHYDALTAASSTSLNQSFSYDELSRLAGITAASASWSIGYDANGNRTAVTLNGSMRNYSVSATSNRLNALSNPTRSLGYDAAGNTTSDSGTTPYTATYDAAGRTATLTQGTTTSTYAYDGEGRRVRKHSSTGPASAILFAYDQGGQLLGEYDQAGSPIREYVWLGNTPVAVFVPDAANAANPPQIFYIHTDHLDTPRVVTDTEGNLRWRWLAEPFGTTAPETNPQGMSSFTLPLRMPGQYADSESGLFYNYFRSYDGSTGRYTQSDPIGLQGGINTYAYVEGNPLSLTDEDGLNPRAIQMSFNCGYRIGQEINPYVQPYISRAVDALFLPDPMLATPAPRSPAQMTQAERRQFEYLRAKDFCDAPPPPGSNECSKLSRQIDHANEVIKLYELWDAKWQPGRHADKLQTWKKRLQKLKDDHNKKCPDRCEP